MLSESQEAPPPQKETTLDEKIITEKKGFSLTRALEGFLNKIRPITKEKISGAYEQMGQESEDSTPQPSTETKKPS